MTVPYRILIVILIFLGCSSFANPVNVIRRYEQNLRTRAAAQVTANCETVFKSKELALFFQGLHVLKKVNSPLWFQYKPEQRSVVLTHSELGSNCAVVISDFKLLGRLTLNQPIKIENGLFNFYSDKRPGQVPVDLKQFLDRSRISLALLFNLAELDPGSAPRRSEPKLTLSEFMDIFVHELFHVYTVFPPWVKSDKGLPWPKWDQQPARFKMDALCYTSPAALPWTQKEQEMAIKMTQSLFTSNDLKTAMAFGREFLKHRKARYQVVANVRVPSEYEPQGITCEKAEAIMELEEGGAQYVGNITALMIGLYPLTKLIKYMSDLNSWFYMSGLAQLSLLYRINGPRMDQLTLRLSKSTQWEHGIGFEFKKALGMSL